MPLEAALSLVLYTNEEWLGLDLMNILADRTQKKRICDGHNLDNTCMMGLYIFLVS